MDSDPEKRDSAALTGQTGGSSSGVSGVPREAIGGSQSGVKLEDPLREKTHEINFAGSEVTLGSLDANSSSLEMNQKPSATSESALNASAKQKKRKTWITFAILGVVAVVLVTVIAIIVTAINTKKMCEETLEPEKVVECAPKDQTTGERLAYLRDKIKTFTTAGYAPEYIPEIISLYDRYFELLDMQEYPELYQDANTVITTRDIARIYGKNVADYTKKYDDIVQTSDSAACAFNNLYYYGYNDLANEYLKIMKERQIEEGFNPDQGGMG